MDGSVIKTMVAELAPVIREYVQQSFAPIEERIAALEARPEPKRGPEGRGISGASMRDDVLVLQLTDNSEIEVEGVKGADGKDGITPSGLPETFFDIMRAEVYRQVGEAVSELPPPEKGEKGDRGEQGPDGRGVKELLIDRNGELIATMDDGTTKNLGPIVGKDGQDGADGAPGEPGKDGRDGFSLEDFSVECGADGRTYVLKFETAEARHDYELTFPVPVYCGYFKEGEQYAPGDLVTWGGEMWHCDKQTTSKPNDVESWTLAVKKGRNGKDAK